MDRRLIGALLVAAVVAVSIIVPARDGLRMPGTPTMVALPADPVIGDCLVEPAGDFWAGAKTIDDTRPDQTTGPDQTTRPDETSRPDESPDSPLVPVFESCAGQPVAGEVVAIVTATGSPHARRQQVEESDVDCRGSSLEYAGLIPVENRHTVHGELAVDPVSWRFSIDLRGTWVLPSALLQTAGRTWAACVVAPATAVRYGGTIAGAYQQGSLPDAFGTCWDRPVLSPGIRSVACDEPHKAELISTGTVPNRGETTAADITRSCERLAAQVMRRDDPTAAGGITVMVSPQTSDEQIRRIPNLDIVCFVTPTAHSLAGTLVGVGDRPIPYAG